MASNFPKLPGYVPTHEPFTDKFNPKKVSHVHLEKIRNHKDGMQFSKPVPLYAVPSPPVANFTETKADASKSLSHCQFPNHYGEDINEQFEPVYVKLDKQVLKFFAYTKESVVESRLENYRIRKVHIFYYLVDKSIMITEPRQQDSGVPQGAFFKQKCLQKGDGSAYEPQDFSIGTDIAILARQWRIYDVDEYTREFYERLSGSQPPAQDCPNDNFVTSKIPILPKKDPEMLHYMEKKLGGGKVQSQKQFLDHDRKVLRFYCEFQSRPFIITYFLADDTVEVLEVHTQNDGYDSFTKLLARRKLPETNDVKQPGQAFIGDNYLTCNEIMPGSEINCFGHLLKIAGVDEYTQNYYAKTYQRHFPLGGHYPPLPRDRVAQEVPPHTNLMGGERDSLGYIKRLVPHRPKVDEFKALDNDKKILRFTARFNTRVPEDQDRRFIISFYLADDTISIYEPLQKNSGIVHGKFLERNQYKNLDKPSDIITPSDMALGGDVKINGHSFHLLSCDEYTQSYLSQYYV